VWAAVGRAFPVDGMAARGPDSLPGLAELQAKGGSGDPPGAATLTRVTEELSEQAQDHRRTAAIQKLGFKCTTMTDTI
jgi:hypothetical protein